MDEEREPYSVAKQSGVAKQLGKFDVIAPSGRSILTCGDVSSARHYAALLSQAYQQGYKDGYHDAKNAEG